MRALKNDPRVEAVILNKKLSLDKPIQSKQEVKVDESQFTYGLQLMNVPEAWKLGVKGKGVRVGIIDSGIDENHPELQGKVLLSKDFTKDGHTHDRNGHGTHVAGTIAGGNKSGPHIGVAPDAKLIIAKVFNDKGSTDMATLLAAMGWFKPIWPFKKLFDLTET